MSDDERFVEFRVSGANSNPWEHGQSVDEAPWDGDALGGPELAFAESPVQPGATRHALRADTLGLDDDGDLASLGFGWRGALHPGAAALDAQLARPAAGSTSPLPHLRSPFLDPVGVSLGSGFDDPFTGPVEPPQAADDDDGDVAAPWVISADPSRRADRSPRASSPIDASSRAATPLHAEHSASPAPEAAGAPRSPRASGVLNGSPSRSPSRSPNRSPSRSPNRSPNRSPSGAPHQESGHGSLHGPSGAYSTADPLAHSESDPFADSSDGARHAAELPEKARDAENDAENDPAPPYQEHAPGSSGAHADERPESITSPKADPHKSAHSRNSSHYEYHQDATGNIEKLRVYDDSGLPVEDDDNDDDSWEPMATVGSYEVYDDKNNLLVELEKENEATGNAAASGYTRVANNDDAASVTSLDDKTDFLFDGHKPTDDVDAAFQMSTTKSMLTDEQRIAYCGVCRLGLAELGEDVRSYGPRARLALESLQMWGSKAILRLYKHLDLNNDEQLMIESLAAHSLLAEDLTPCLKRVQHVADGVIVQDKDQKGARADELHEEVLDTASSDAPLEVDVRWTVMCDLFLILVADGVYDSRSRTLLTLLGSKLGVTANEVAQFERKITDVLQLDEPADQDWTEEEIIEARRRKALRRKYAMVGLATVGGGLVIGLSAGLLAPVVGAGLAAGLGTIGITGTSSFLAGAGGTAIIATASTAIGAHVGSRSMLRRVGHVKTFEFRPIFNNNRVNMVIAVPGWMTGKDDDVRLPFSTIDPVMGDVFSVLWEPEMMRSLGQTINILATEALAQGVQQILAATVLTALLTSLQLPMWLAKLSYLVDNPWSVSLDRAWAAGLILADTLMQRNLGGRPATLVGYSLGSRVIYSCLTELARRNAYGLVQDVYLFGTPVFYNKKKFTSARSVVSGRWINGYSNKDWILAFLFPARKRYGNVLGLDPVPDADNAVLKVENVDFSEEIDGHMSYRSKMPRLLSLSGWAVMSEEFDEIDDPDPEQLREKQRKLLNELESADKPKKTGFFSSWKLDWMQRANAKQPETATAGSSNEGVLFDVDAIKGEMSKMQPQMVFDADMDEAPTAEVPTAATADQLPLELIDVEPERPESSLDYDDPASPKPLPKAFRSKAAEPDLDVSPKPQGRQPQLVFDDLE